MEATTPIIRDIAILAPLHRDQAGNFSIIYRHGTSTLNSEPGAPPPIRQLPQDKNAVHFATISIDQCLANTKELQPNQFAILVKVQKHFWAPIVLNQRAQRNVLRDRAWVALSRMCRKVQIGNVIISPSLQSYLRLDHA